MTCARCHAEHTGKRWCVDCERTYDGWKRQYATDVLVPLFGGMGVLVACAMALPAVGTSVLLGMVGALAGFATVGGLASLNMVRRRRQFLREGVPRAYLPAPSTTR